MAAWQTFLKLVTAWCLVVALAVLYLVVRWPEEKVRWWED